MGDRVPVFKIDMPLAAPGVVPLNDQAAEKLYRDTRSGVVQIVTDIATMLTKRSGPVPLLESGPNSSTTI